MSFYFPQEKTIAGAAYPIYATGLSDAFKRSEPLISPGDLQSRYMKNIPTKFPHDEITTDDFRTQINLAMNRIEAELDIDIYPVTRSEKLPFTRTEYRNFVMLRTRMGPILKIEHVCVRSSNGQRLFDIPSEWIDPGNFHYRQINVIPIMGAYGFNTLAGSSTQPAGIVLLSVLGGIGWIPSFWEVKYTSGISLNEGQVPVIVNELIGLEAAKNLISMAQSAYTKGSVSISQDGLSQSSSGLGTQTYKQRMDDIQVQIDQIKHTIKKKFFKKFLTGFA